MNLLFALIFHNWLLFKWIWGNDDFVSQILVHIRLSVFIPLIANVKINLLNLVTNNRLFGEYVGWNCVHPSRRTNFKEIMYMSYSKARWWFCVIRRTNLVGKWNLNSVFTCPYLHQRYVESSESDIFPAVGESNFIRNFHMNTGSHINYF